MREAGFILDLGRCVGCAACVLACRLENGWPRGVSWRRVLSLNLDRFGSGPTYHFSLACHHCERPACLAACPAGAFEKLPDGAVLLDRRRCVGCRYCEMACPFGALSYDDSAGIMTKCHFCRERIDSGDLAACVAACPTQALAIPGEKEETPAPGKTVPMPGFSDPAGCGPNLRLIPPRGRIRAQLLEKLREVLNR